MSRAGGGRRRLRPALLSALVFPGLGQLAQGRLGLGLAFGGGSLALLVVLLRRVVVEARARLPEDPALLFDPSWPFRVADEIHRANASFFFWTTAGLLALWAGSAFDAWYGSRSDEEHPASPPRSTALEERSQVRFCSHCGARLPAPPPVTCAACGTGHWRDAKPCAGALVTRDGRLLLVRRARNPWRGLWDIPGGFCGPAEHPETAAAREIREETGLRVRLGGVLGMWMDTYAASGPDAEKATLNIYFHASLDGDADPAPDPTEVVELAWFAPEALPDELAFPGHVPAVLRAWRQTR